MAVMVSERTLVYVYMYIAYPVATFVGERP
jgi:hypothetical protein